MKGHFVTLGVLFAGLLAGYGGYPLLHPSASLPSETPGPGVNARVLASCELSPEQVDRISARVAPAVVERLATSGLNGVAPDPELAARERRLVEQTKTEQARAFDEATRLVDEMIASGQVTRPAMNEAIKLLQQSGQGDRAFELNARVAAAVNRKELTPRQAGFELGEAP
jgi:hypothetical protein